MQGIKDKYYERYCDLYDNIHQIPFIFHEYRFSKDITEVEPIYEIHMCGPSIPFFIKSLLVESPGAIFLTSTINLFQSLPTTSGDKPICYDVVSHSLTIKLLRILEKNGLIEITDFDKLEDKVNFTQINRIIGNAPRRRDVQLYEIFFIKKRNIGEEDIPIIDKLIRSFHIPENSIEYYEKYSTIYTRFTHEYLRSSIASGTPVKQLRMRLSNLENDKTK